MTYELALRLKNAGFPQDVYHENSARGLEARSRAMIRNYDIYFPTLEELIEACGDGFTDLMSPYDCLNEKGKLIKSGSKEGWKALGSPCVLGEGKDDLEKSWHSRWPTGIGSTPSEAVAGLYIALHEK